MFTGIIEDLGEVISCESEGDVHRLVLRASRAPEDLEVGGSVAVNGCCLTATRIEGRVLHFDLARETVARTRFDKRLRKGVLVNLERPLRLSSRLDGHLVQGHIDGVGTVSAIRESGTSSEITFDLPKDLARYCVEKGSVAIDGISLTCAGVKGTRVSVAVIAHTLKATTLGRVKVTDPVCVEVDMVAKYVEKLLPK
jgi:riboflavin synthase